VPTQAKEIVERVRRSVEESKGTRLWDDFTNALNLISQVVFTRSSGFLLELMQNAEDSGINSGGPGVLEIILKRDRVVVRHNGEMFSAKDVEAISGIRSSKKPERGTLGYLGIGFKSVFKVSDCPRIYSGDFRFKFDRNAWADPASTPWHVIPLWVDEAPDEDEVPPGRTTFVIPLTDGNTYPALSDELTKIKTELFLFLKWLRRIEITDEPADKKWTLENLGEDESGVTKLRQADKEHRFKFFRRTVSVPDSVKVDRLTQQFRENVVQREIAIAFSLDDAGNLDPSPATAMYGGVYSFVPLGEASSGAKFPIQADFLVQPGRDAINYEAIWNHWLLEEVSDLCQEAILEFKSSPIWKFQFLPAFDFTHSQGHESFDKLFGPRLVSPVEAFINADPCIPTTTGGWSLLIDVVRLKEDTKAKDSLESSGILAEKDIASVLGGSPTLTLADPRVKEAASYAVRSVDRRDLLSNQGFLDSKASVRDAAWFQKLYRWLADNPVRLITQYGREYRVTEEEFNTKWRYEDGRTYRANFEPYHAFEFILAADHQLHRGGGVQSPDFQSSDPLFAQLAQALQATRPILHPTILATASNESDRNKIRGFLTGRAGVQTLDAKRVCDEAILPRIVTSAPKPTAKELLQMTRWFAGHVKPWELPPGTELWVITKRAGVRRAREVVLGVEFLTGQDWETNRVFVPGVVFLSNRYLPKGVQESDIAALRELFKRGGVKEAPDNGVEDFAVGFTVSRLRTRGIRARRIEKRNYGYDLQARARAGNHMRIEVKGLSVDGDVELTGNEASSADRYQSEFYLCIVSGIPNNPLMYMVSDPVKVGKKDKLRVPAATWKKHKWR
jgi:hypothetical protein